MATKRWALGLIFLAAIPAVYLALQFASPRDAVAPTPDAETVAAPEPLVPRKDGAVVDPRLAYSGPFLNVKPGVKSVGDAACNGCHAGIVHSYHQHPMGRSAAFTNNEPDLPGPKRITADGYDLEVVRTDAGVAHRVSFPGEPKAYAANADVTIGSGAHGMSFLTVVDGAVWQTPISWFSNLNGYALSPGYDLSFGGQRAIVGSCLYCHVNHVDPVDPSVNLFKQPVFGTQAAIGCERCHGPGELHVNFHLNGGTADKPDLSIVNPKHLSADLQRDVCRQCHLQAKARVTRRGLTEFDYRPGLPWDQFVSTFVTPPESIDLFHSVGQFEQLETSKCYTKSNTMTCTTCHDPHVSPKREERPDFYRAKCLTCHTPETCTAPPTERAAKSDRCTVCHMPKADSTSIVHASVIDHRIPRRPTPDRKARGGADRASVVAYPPGPQAPNAEERERDHVMALLRTGGGYGKGQDFKQELDRRIRTVLTRFPGDRDLWLGWCSELQGNDAGAESFRIHQAWAKLEPENKQLAAGRRFHALLQRKPDEALAAADLLVKAVPSSIDHLVARGIIHLAKLDLPTANRDADAALAIQPLHPRARVLKAILIFADRGTVAGQKACDDALKLAPSIGIQYELRDWYRRETSGK